MLHFLSPTATPTPAQVRALERVSESWVPHASWGEELRPQRGPESPPVPGGRSSRSSAPLPWARRAGPASGSGPDVPEAEMVGRGPRRANLTDPAAAFTGQGCPSEKNEDDGWTPGRGGESPCRGEGEKTGAAVRKGPAWPGLGLRRPRASAQLVPAPRLPPDLCAASAGAAGHAAGPETGRRGGGQGASAGHGQRGGQGPSGVGGRLCRPGPQKVTATGPRTTA